MGIRRKVVCGLGVGALCLGGAALADELVADADGDLPVEASGADSNTMSLGNVCYGDSGTADAVIAIARKGTFKFKNGSDVTVTVTSTSDPQLAATVPSSTGVDSNTPHLDDNLVTMPDNWEATAVATPVAVKSSDTTDSNGDPYSDYVTSVVTFTPSSATQGAFSGTVQYTASGTSASNVPRTATDTITVTASNVGYCGISGIQQPINSDNTSLFKRGKSVPVKFQLANDAPTGFNTSGWTVERGKADCTSFDSSEATVEATATSTSAAGLRYDAAADQYIYNADSSGLTPGQCYKYRANLGNNQFTPWSGVFKISK